MFRRCASSRIGRTDGQGTAVDFITNATRRLPRPAAGIARADPAARVSSPVPRLREDTDDRKTINIAVRPFTQHRSYHDHNSPIFGLFSSACVLPTINSVPDLPPIPVTIRSFRPEDAETCKRLYQEGLIGPAIAPNDTGLDIDNIERAYMSSSDSHFWVAENSAGEIVGMIGVQQHDHGTGEIRRLRVRQDHRRRGIGTALLEKALAFCRDQQHLKIILDTYMDREPAIRLFEKFRFKLSRTRELQSKTTLYFYLDIYSGDPTRRKQ